MLYIKGRPVARSTARSTEHGPKVAKAYTTYYSQPQVDGCQYVRVPDPILSFSLTTTTPHHSLSILLNFQLTAVTKARTTSVHQWLVICFYPIFVLVPKQSPDLPAESPIQAGSEPYKNPARSARRSQNLTSLISVSGIM